MLLFCALHRVVELPFIYISRFLRAQIRLSVAIQIGAKGAEGACHRALTTARATWGTRRGEPGPFDKRTWP